MVSTKYIPGTSLLFEFQLYISVAVSAPLSTKAFTSVTFRLITTVAVSFISKKWCNIYGLTIKLEVQRHHHYRIKEGFRYCGDG